MCGGLIRVPGLCFACALRIKHYAGDVTYEVLDFPENNKDTLTRDIQLVIKASEAPLVQVLFADMDPVGDAAAASAGGGARKKITTAGFKIKQQIAALVKTLSDCELHYVRCIKSNDEKRANVMTDQRVHHQITYLGLTENIKVRRFTRFKTGEGLEKRVNDLASDVAAALGE